LKEISTKYGELKGISSIEFYSQGTIKECKLNEYSKLSTIYGDLVPQYDETEVRRKYKRSLSFYENGNIQSISFQKQTTLDTKIGKLPAELALFYENGNIKRIFPLNGKITAYWTEENEYRLADELNLSFEFGDFKMKIIGVCFYESGEVKSVTFWPKDFINVISPLGLVEIRIGLSLYPNGKIKSCEPRKQTLISTVIGDLHAYDLAALGLNGDRNSLNFNLDGSIKALCTSTDRITITAVNGQVNIHEPSLKVNNFNNTIMDVVPIEIEFYLDKTKIDGKEYNIKDNKFYIERFVRKHF